MVSKAEAPYPYLPINGMLLDEELLDAAWSELMLKAPLWEAGFDEPSPVERLAYRVLRQITMREPNPDLKIFE